MFARARKLSFVFGVAEARQNTRYRTCSRHASAQRYEPRTVRANVRFFSHGTRQLARGHSDSRSPLLSVESAVQILRENETTHSTTAGVLRYDFNSLPANSPCEDQGLFASAEGRHYCAVFDGHGGPYLSYTLAEQLVPRVALELQQAASTADTDVHAAIKHAFIQLDEDVVRAPMRYLERTQGPLSPEGEEELLLWWTLATQGSCALLAVIDAPMDRLHVAVTGDSRAVMGTWDGARWATQVLTEDQTSANPKEAARLQSEHPASEAYALVKDGRTLDLGMSRAFGDAMMKWSAKEILTTSQAVFGQEIAPYADCKTPPYITAEPEVVSLPLKSPHGRRFVVLASDGVYEWLSSVELVALVGAHLDGVRGGHSRDAIAAQAYLSEHALDAYIPPPIPGPGPWGFVFEDTNAATHVIRNAIAGNESRQLQLHLDLPLKTARNYRDDMTVFVVILEDTKIQS